MATTTNYAWETPDDTDLVKDGAAAIRTLGSSVDTTTKALNPSTTLGDIEYRSATANTNTRLGIGSTGNVLRVAGGVPTWSALPASAPASATATVNTSESTTSTSYTNLATVGPEVTLTTGTKVLVIISCNLRSADSGGEVFADVAISGATTRAADDTTDSENKGNQGRRWSTANIFTVTAGSNTFTMKYKSDSFNCTFRNRSIIVVDLGS